MKVIKKECQVGIYENCAYVARIYKDRIVVTVPYVKWVGNSGSYDERKVRIVDAETVRTVTQAVTSGNTEKAWGTIGRSIGDAYIANADW